MISFKSLSEQFLPNMYVDSVTLNQELTPKNTLDKKKNFGIVDTTPALGEGGSQTMVPGNTMTSTVVTSAKFVQTKTLNQDLVELFDSITEETISIYVHQITNRQFYINLMKSIYNIPVGTSLNSLPPEVIQPFITIHGGIQDPIKTIKRSFKQAFENTKNFKMVSSSGTPNTASKDFQLPEKRLDDGTILNEIIMEASFQGIPKNTNFLAYIVLTSISSTTKAPENPGGVEEILSGPYISNIRKEIVLLDGKLQNQALEFRIQPYPSNANQQILSQYGKPGDIWTGGVHIHNGRFMAGSWHGQYASYGSGVATQPYLDYSIVPNNRFIDNRVKQDIERTVINTTQIIEELNSFVSMYKYSNPLNAKIIKQKQNFFSDMHLFNGPDREVGKVNGAFFVDKQEIIKNNSVFSFLFDKAKYFSNSANLTQTLLDYSTLIRCDVYDGNKLVGSISESQPIAIVKKGVQLSPGGTIPQGSASPEDIGFVIKKENSEGGISDPQKSTFSGLESFSFKHHTALEGVQPAKHYHKKYSVSVEYRDGTVDFVKNTVKRLRNISKNLDEVVTFLNSKAGSTKPAIDYNSQRISSFYYDKLIDNEIATKNGTAVYPYVFNQFINSGVIQDLVLIIGSTASSGGTTGDAQASKLTQDAAQIIQYLKNSLRINTTTMSHLLVAQQFLNNVVYSLDTLLNDLGVAKPPKTTVLTPYGKSTNNTASGYDKTIKAQSKENEVTLYNYGYDFTGMVDVAASDDSQNTWFGRGKLGFLKLQVNDYQKMCRTLAKQVLTESIIPSDSFNHYWPGGGYKNEDSYYTSLYSFLCAPAGDGVNNHHFRKFIYLPYGSLMAVKQFKNSEEFNPQTAFTAIQKFKSNIDEYHYHLSDIGKVLAKDLASILNKDGTNVVQNEQFLQAEQIEDFFQKNQNTINEKDDLLNPTDNSLKLLGDKDGNAFKITPQPENLINKDAQANPSINNLLLALIARKQMSSATINDDPLYGFNLGNPFETYKPKGLTNSYIKDQFSKDQYSSTGLYEKFVPLQILCFVSYGDNKFKDFLGLNQGYISFGSINPARLAQYYFIHQNIVRVEYLDGFEETTLSIPVNTTLNNQYSAPETTEYTRTFRNLKKPIWKTLDEATFSSVNNSEDNKTVLCRLVRYTPDWINGKLVEKFKLPLFNSYFKLGYGQAYSTNNF